MVGRDERSAARNLEATEAAGIDGAPDGIGINRSYTAY
jgi:hypothetical protein